MKKIYSLITFLITAVGFSQPFTETFENSPYVSTDVNYSDKTFTGVEGIEWKTVHSRGEGDFAITGKGVMLRRAQEPSSIEATFPNGLSQFSFQYRKAFTSNAPRKLSIYVNDALVDATPVFGNSTAAAETTIYTYTLPETTILSINVNEPVTIKITVAIDAGAVNTNRQATIDNVIWAPNDVEVNEPSIVLTPAALEDFTYNLNDGPAEIQTIEVSGAALDESDVMITVTGDFEVSLDGGTFHSEVILEAFTGDSKDVSVRLKDGLEEGDYEGTLSVTGGGLAEAVTLSLKGIVTPAASNPDFNTANFVMYPNPATDWLWFNEVVNVEVYNLNGKKVATALQVEKVDVSGLSAGIYVVKTSNGAIKKLVKK